jgi:hypothetical protein
MSLILQFEMGSEGAGGNFENPVKASPLLFNFAAQRESCALQARIEAQVSLLA